VKSLNFGAGATFRNLHFPNLISSKFTGGGTEQGSTTRVKVFRIDQLVNLDSIRSKKILIKIDVEENEKEILEGIADV
jgi:FkbM family methyltransferase